MRKGINIGKIEDSGDLVMGGRIDNYWVNNPDMNVINKKISDANKIHTEVFTADQNEFINEFGFKSVEFGNWLNQPERYYFLYNTAVSFKHLADVFRIPNEMIGFLGKLSIAFGARGRQGALAHYESYPNIIINLTKNKGHHSLAHEYGHAIDNLLGYYLEVKGSAYLSGGSSVRTKVDDELLLSSNYFVRKFEELFSKLYYDEKGNETKFLKTLKTLPNRDYLLKRTEVFARTFEVYVADKLEKAGIENKFLTKDEKFKGHYPAKLIDKFSPVMDSIINNAYRVFETKTVEERKKEENNKLFSLGAVDVLAANIGKKNFNGFKPTYKELDSYDHLIIDSSTPNKTVFIQTGGLEETIQVIKRIIDEYKYQVEPLAKHLKANTLEQSCFNIWHFIVHNIKYNFDLAGKEEIRTPARSWKDRFNRADCEDYAVFAASLLINMGYSPKLRIVAFNNKPQYQHIYIMANNICIDAVLHTFNSQPPNITKTMDIEVLSGLGNADVENKVVSKLMNSQSQLIKMARDKKHRGIKPQLLAELRKIRYALLIQGTPEFKEIMPVMSQIKDITGDGKFIFKKNADIVGIANYMEAVVNKSSEELAGLGAVDLQDEMVKSMIKSSIEQRDLLMEAIASGKIKYEEVAEAIQEVDKLEALLKADEASLSGFFSKIGDLAKGVWDKVSGAVKTVANKVGDVASAVWDKVKDAGKAVGGFIIKYNPLSILARNSYLLLLRLNVRGMANKIATGYASNTTLKQRGHTGADITNIRGRRNKIEDLWKKLGGDVDALKKAALTSKKAKEQAGLGEISVAAALASASGIIAAVTKIANTYKSAKEKIDDVSDIAKLAEEKIKAGSEKLQLIKDKVIAVKDKFTGGSAPRTAEPTPTVANKEEQDFIEQELYNGGAIDSGATKSDSGLSTGAWIAISLLGVGVVGGSVAFAMSGKGKKGKRRK